MKRLIYIEPKTLTRHAAEAAFASDQSELICSALTNSALTDPDWQWVQGKCLAFARHPDAAVRQSAATSLGHLARIHKKLEMDRVAPVIEDLLKDGETYMRGCADDAIDDIEIFMGIDLRRR